MTTMHLTDQRLRVNGFSPAGGTGEYCITGTAPEELPLSEALFELAKAYEATLIETGLDASTQQFARIMLSDAANDHEQFYSSALYRMVSHAACSVIEQCPLEGGQVTIFAYHVKSPADGIKWVSSPPGPDRSLLMQGNNYSLFWSPGLHCSTEDGSERQTLKIFRSLESSLAQLGMSVKSNTVRTWLYVRDIDNNYTGMVKARRDFFETIGLTNNFRFIASTGIEGKAAETKTLVTLDALSIKGIREDQIIRMEAPHHMSSTIAYGVTFERGTRIRFGDRSHLYISGTASIDHTGATVYLRDIKRQIERTLDNVEALLSPQGATFDDLFYLTVYLRNPKHFPILKSMLAERIPENVPVIPVVAPVCRPEWLFEVDGQAIIPDQTKFPVFA
jgi:enamine deaminase RidA (YjgF/YER057c/UK114 family)